MKKEELSEYIGKNVIVTLFEGTELWGCLEYIPEFSSKYGWRKPGFFAIENHDFRVSHVRKIRELGGAL